MTLRNTNRSNANNAEYGLPIKSSNKLNNHRPVSYGSKK